MDGAGTSIDQADDVGAGPGAARPMRADAVKNRQRILAAAAEVFASQGVSVPIDLVAERAGVGVGTLYRHFPTKDALFEAIVLTKLTGLIATACAAADAEDPERALFEFLGLFASEAAMKHDLFDALDTAGIDIKSRCSASVDELQRGIDRLLRREVEAGAVRDDVGADEIVSLVIGTCHAVERMRGGADSVQRLIGILCEGLRRVGAEG